MAHQVLLLFGGVWRDYAGVGESIGGEEAGAILVLKHVLYGLFLACYPLAGTYQRAVLLLLVQGSLEPEEDLGFGTD